MDRCAKKENKVMKLGECARTSLFAPALKTTIRLGVRIPLVNRLAVCSILAMLASCLLLTAQNVVLTGSLSGRVTDPSGAVVPGASVVVQNLATGVQQTAETNHDGLYRFPVVMPGTYSITASLKSFRDVQVLVRVTGRKHYVAGHQAAGGSERGHG